MRSHSGSIPPRPGSSCSLQQTPARYVAFDLLAVDDEVLLAEPFGERRSRLERALA